MLCWYWSLIGCFALCVLSVLFAVSRSFTESFLLTCFLEFGGVVYVCNTVDRFFVCCVHYDPDKYFEFKFMRLTTEFWMFWKADFVIFFFFSAFYFSS